MNSLIPPQALAQHTAVLGKTGSGKTSTAKLTIEQVVADGARVCILDPIKSDWWGLTSSADGKKPGLSFQILGGPRGHVPLHSSAGKAIGELVGSGALPLSIIDMAHFEPGGIQRFFIDFAEALFKTARGVVYLVMEEAHEFAPKERSNVGNENMAIYWAKRLATSARSKGIRLILVTQRSQSLHNALLGSCDTMIVHRLTLPADQKPVKDWLKDNTPEKIRKEVESSFAKLKTGTAWLCSAEAEVFELMQFPRIQTYDNSATPTSDEAAAEIVTAAVDRDALRSIIGKAVEEAEANDPKKLREQNARLQNEIDHQRKKIDTLIAYADEVKAATPPPFDARAIYDDGYSAGFKAAQYRITEPVRMIKTEIDKIAAEFTAMIEPPTELPQHWRQTPISSTETAAAIVRTEHRDTALRDASEAFDIESALTLSKGERRVLTAIAQQKHGATRPQLTALLGYKRSARDTYISRLSKQGYVETGLDRITATAAGRAALGRFEPLPTGRELRQHWLTNLPMGEARILRVLIDFYPKPIDRSVLDEQTGYKRSARDTYLSRLSARELVTTPTRGTVAASPDLF